MVEFSTSEVKQPQKHQPVYQLKSKIKYNAVLSYVGFLTII